MIRNNLGSEIESKAHELNFECLGFCSSQLLDKNIENYLKQFVLEGRHGTMDWIADTIERRVNPINLWADANIKYVEQSA